MNQRTIDRCINIAKSMSPLNLAHRCSHVAFLIGKGGRICHIGINSNKTHPKTIEFNYENYNDKLCRIHAEFSTVFKASVKEKTEDLSHYELINIRIDRKGNINNGRPCSGCRHVAQQFGIKHIYYSTAEGTVNYEKI
jgi:cytidine deaminase